MSRLAELALWLEEQGRKPPLTRFDRKMIDGANTLREAESLLLECDEYLEAREDVRDGSDGRPLPNAAMSLRMQVRALLGK